MTQEEVDPRDVRNAGNAWTENEVMRFTALSAGNTPMRLIVRELGRPEEELRAKAVERGINLDSAIYNRQWLREDE